jgi:hypothetical protein
VRENEVDDVQSSLLCIVIDQAHIVDVTWMHGLNGLVLGHFSARQIAPDRVSSANCTMPYNFSLELHLLDSSETNLRRKIVTFCQPVGFASRNIEAFTQKSINLIPPLQNHLISHHENLRNVPDGKNC